MLCQAMDNDDYYYYANASDFIGEAGAAKRRWENLLRALLGSRKKVRVVRDRAGDGYIYGFTVTIETLKCLESYLSKHNKRRSCFFIAIDSAIKAKDTLVLNPLHEAFLVDFLAQIEGGKQ
jgi:hypothetical protein